MPRRLSYEEKRDRLMAVTNYTDQRERNQALGQVIERMQSWWQHHPILPMPKLYDISEEGPSSSSSTTTTTKYSFSDSGDEEQEQRFPEIEPPCLEEYVFTWRRNRRSKCCLHRFIQMNIIMEVKKIMFQRAFPRCFGRDFGGDAECMTRQRILASYFWKDASSVMKKCDRYAPIHNL